MYDVVVVGARCAGASTALLFARAGYRVLILDRAKLPADKLSTLYIHQAGVIRLRRWGLLDDVLATNCPPLGNVVYEVGGVRLEGCAPETEGVREAVAPRRIVLDEILIKAAVNAGAEFHDGCSVNELSTVSDSFGDDRVTGVRYRDTEGVQRTVRAPLVVGADGMRSPVARMAGASEYAVEPKATCAYYTYWDGLTADFELYESPGHWVGVVPTNDGHTLIAAYFRQSEFGEVRGDVQGNYLRNIRSTAPDLAERLDGCEMVDRMHGTGDQLNFFRHPAGDGWALVGDSGYHKDSITARGITDAFLQAELLADTVAAHAPGALDDPARMAVVAKQYHAQRDQLLDPVYRTTLSVARLEVTAERLALLRAVRRSPDLIERYFGALGGVVAPEALYTPELMSLLVQEAA